MSPQSLQTPDTVVYSPALILSLKHMISAQGKLLPRRLSGRSAKHHRRLVRQVKQARMFGFLPFVIRK